MADEYIGRLRAFLVEHQHTTQTRESHAEEFGHCDDPHDAWPVLVLIEHELRSQQISAERVKE